MSFCHHTINVRCPNCKSIAERHVTLHDSHDALEIRHDALRKERDELLADLRELLDLASSGWLDDADVSRIAAMRKKWGEK